jgi:hypothetical protein
MLTRIRSGLTFANVVSMLALFVALSGGAYALTIPKNSVGAKQLKKNAVTRSKIKNGAVTSSKVKTGSLLAEDFKARQLPAGPPGPKGDTGASVKDAPLPTRTTVFSQSGGGVATAVCPAGYVAVGGGGNTGSAAAGLKLSEPQSPSGDDAPTQWHVQSTNTAEMVIAYVVCESP